MEIQLGAKSQEHAAEADRGAVHEDEFARHGQRALRLQSLVHGERLAPAVMARLDAVGAGANAIVDQRSIDEARPDVERVDRLALQFDEAPGLVGVDDPRLVLAFQALVQIDDAADKARRENADAAVVEEIDPGDLVAFSGDRVIAEMRVAMNDAVMRERPPPRLERAPQTARNAIALASHSMV